MAPTSARQLALSNLSLPTDTYIFSLASSRSQCTVISSDDSLRYFDPSTLKVLQSVARAHDGVTCLCSNSSDGSNVGDFVTAGRDGLVRSWDSRGKRANWELRDPKGTGFTALACRGTTVAAGTESTKEGLGDVSVLLWDTRKPSAPFRQYTESHNDTITQLSFHPSKSNILLSAATDGLVSLFDTTIADEDDALTQVLNHYSAVHCAGFVDEEEVYAVSSDEQLSVYTLSKPDDAEDAVLPVTTFGDVREQLQCSYVVDVLPTAGSPPAWIAAGDTSTNRLSLTPLLPKWSFGDETMLLPGGHGGEVVRDVLVDSQHRRIFTCGEDGHIRLWAPEEQTHQPMTEAMEVDSPDKTKKKKKRKGKKEERFKPY